MIRKGLCTPAANGLCHIALYLNIKLLSDRCSLQLSSCYVFHLRHIVLMVKVLCMVFIHSTTLHNPTTKGKIKYLLYCGITVVYYPEKVPS